MQNDKLESIQILGFNVDSSLETLEIDHPSKMVSTFNPHCYCVSKSDSQYRQALQQSEILIPDGIGVVWAIKFLTGIKIKRIAGADLHKHLMMKMDQTGGKVFYLGAKSSTLQKIEARVSHEFPNIQVKSYSPPYKNEFSEDDNKTILSLINTFKPDLLFVGMTAPKQEKWSYQHKNLLDVKVIASIGAVFDFYAGTVKRPGRFWQKMGLEWLLRLLREPKRLWRRYFVSTPCFMWDVIKSKF